MAWSQKDSTQGSFRNSHSWWTHAYFQGWFFSQWFTVWCFWEVAVESGLCLKVGHEMPGCWLLWDVGYEDTVSEGAFWLPHLQEQVAGLQEEWPEFRASLSTAGHPRPYCALSILNNYLSLFLWSIRCPINRCLSWPTLVIFEVYSPAGMEWGQNWCSWGS